MSEVTEHQKRLMDVAASISRLVHYYRIVENMEVNQAIRFAFARVEDLRDGLLEDALSDE